MKDKTSKPPGKIKRAIRRKKTGVYRAVRPYLAGLAAVAVLTLVIMVAAPGLLPLVLLPLGAVLGIAGDRYREHRALAPQRRQSAHAPPPPLARPRHLDRTAPQSCPSPRSAATPGECARRSAAAPARLAPAEAGILIGTVKGTRNETPPPPGLHERLRRVPPLAPRLRAARRRENNWESQVAMPFPGAAFISSTRADIARDTVMARARGGFPAWWLNPRLDGGFPCNLQWSPLSGCEDYRVAMESAGALIHASPRNDRRRIQLDRRRIQAVPPVPAARRRARRLQHPCCPRLGRCSRPGRGAGGDPRRTESLMGDGTAAHVPPRCCRPAVR